MRRKRVALLLTIPAMVCAPTRVASGQPSSAPAAAHAAPAAVHVVVVGTKPGPSFLEGLQSWFGAGTSVSLAYEPTLSAESVLSPATTDSERRVEVWIDLRKLEAAHTYFVVAGQRHPRFLVRDVPLDNGLDEIGQERVSEAVYASALALWEGTADTPRAELERDLGYAASPVEQPNPPLPPPPADMAPPGAVPTARRSAPPARPPARDYRYSVGSGYGITARGEEGLAHGPELWGTLLWGRHRTAAGVWLSAQYLLPVEPSASNVALRIDGARFRLGPAVRHAVGDFAFETGAGIGADVIHYVATTTAPARALPGNTETRPVANIYAATQLSVGGGRFGLVVQVHFQLEDTHYAVVRPSGPENVLTPWRVQPGLSLVICLDGPAG